MFLSNTFRVCIRSNVRDATAIHGQHGESGDSIDENGACLFFMSVQKTQHRVTASGPVHAGSPCTHKDNVFFLRVMGNFISGPACFGPSVRAGFLDVFCHRSSTS